MAIKNQASEYARGGKTKASSEEYKKSLTPAATSAVPAGTKISIVGGNGGTLIADGSGGWINTNNLSSGTPVNQSGVNMSSFANAPVTKPELGSYAGNTLFNGLLNRSPLERLESERGLDATTPQNPGGSGSGNGGGGASYQATPAVSDPYASIYSLYEQQMNAQRDALNQQRQARLNALQANYNNAKSKLDSSYSSGETELNQNADEALRQAYISNMLNQRNMSQYLAGQGVTGGAAESILANLYNTYGNNRNDIERGRMDNLRQLLANYQGTLGDIENSYLAGMSDADSDYSGAIANALTSYYGNLADLQKQNIANQYKAALGKSGSSSSSSSDTSTELNKTIANGLKNFKDNLSGAKAYLSYMGVPETEQDLYLWNAGFDMSPAATMTNALNAVPTATRAAILNALKRVYSTESSNGQTASDNAMQLMDQYVRQYGLTDDQARALLAEAGF